MLAHSRYVLEALLGFEFSWAGQHRSGSIGWGRALLMHGMGMLIGGGWAVFAWWLKPLYFYWSLPIALPLVVAPLVAVISSRQAWAGWFATPAEVLPPNVVDDWQQLMAQQSPTAMSLSRCIEQPGNWPFVLSFAYHTGRLSAEALQRAKEGGVNALTQAEQRCLLDDKGALQQLCLEIPLVSDKQ